MLIAQFWYTLDEFDTYTKGFGTCAMLVHALWVLVQKLWVLVHALWLLVHAQLLQFFTAKKLLQTFKRPLLIMLEFPYLLKSQHVLVWQCQIICDWKSNYTEWCDIFWPKKSSSLQQQNSCTVTWHDGKWILWQKKCQKIWYDEVEKMVFSLFWRQTASDWRD